MKYYVSINIYYLINNIICLFFNLLIIYYVFFKYVQIWVVIMVEATIFLEYNYLEIILGLGLLEATLMGGCNWVYLLCLGRNRR